MNRQTSTFDADTCVTSSFCFVSEVQCFGSAARTQNMRGLKKLIRRCRGTEDELRQLCTHALSEAAIMGHANIVGFLLPYADPKANHSNALRMSARFAHAECIKRLLPVSDPKALCSIALQEALLHQHSIQQNECVELLQDVSDVACALRALETHFGEHRSLWADFAQAFAAQQENLMLHQAIEHTSSSRPSHKM